jgi:hypothetical protein
MTVETGCGCEEAYIAQLKAELALRTFECEESVAISSLFEAAMYKSETAILYRDPSSHAIVEAIHAKAEMEASALTERNKPEAMRLVAEYRANKAFPD